MKSAKINIHGLTDEEVILARTQFGTNKLNFKGKSEFIEVLKRIATDPMMILLLTASSIYFVSGKIGDGLFLVVAIIFQSSISLFQYSRSKNALEKLNDYSQPKCKVFRNGKNEEIKSEDLVVGDVILVEEGALVAADGKIIQSNDFSINESILTGESMAVNKDKNNEDNFIYSGTAVVSGYAIATITAVGNATRLGKIGESLVNIIEEKTPLEVQIGDFVKKMAIAGFIVFLIVWAINYWNSYEWLKSLLQSLTLAMSILPEEIPVAFTTFMALGAWRLMKNGIVVKQMKTVETLGSATVICTDKTGTITENKMSLAGLYILSSNKIINFGLKLNEEEQYLLSLAMWASEVVPFDPMEKALHHGYKQSILPDERPHFRLVHEYPLSGLPPMMTHVHKNKSGHRIIAAKGAPEAIMEVSNLTETEKENIHKAMSSLASEGYRILGVCVSDFMGKQFPEMQQDLPFKFIGLVAFYDPPKYNIPQVLQDFYNAGIDVKIITGDNEATTLAIAKQIGFRGYENNISGKTLMQLDDEALKACVMKNSVFTRMFPEAKLKIINALKSNNQIVAMTGDGVNDGPALKASHIGIAMGQKGSEIAKQAASLILLEDDLAKMVDAVAMGRKIYSNLKKAIQYIISIHIPIILTVFVPLALGWIYPNIFSPVHIIFLEVIMGPTCSIIYENEPMEKNTMIQKPKPLSNTFFNWKELSISIVQGLAIATGTLTIYQISVLNGNNEALTRTMTFTVLIVSNIFLTLINRSFYYSIITTLQYKNNMVLFIILLTAFLTGLLIYFKPFTAFFEFQQLEFSQLALCIGVGFVSVIWFELFKLVKRKKKDKPLIQ